MLIQRLLDLYRFMNKFIFKNILPALVQRHTNNVTHNYVIKTKCDLHLSHHESTLFILCNYERKCF